MNPQLIEIIYQELRLQDTEQLLEIWQNNDREAYTDEAFEAVRRILRQRMGSDLPLQGAPGMGGPDPRAREYLPPPELRDRPEVQRLRREIGAQRKRRLEAEIEAHLDTARQYDDQDRLQEALAEYDWVIQKAPRRAEIHHARGLLLEDLDRLDEALAAYRQASMLAPEDTEISQDLERASFEQAERMGLENLPEGDDELPELDPPAPFLDSKSWLRGWPGNRTLPERSGLDYVDSEAELGQMEGRLLHHLFTGRLRTANPVYLFLMALLGGLAMLVGIGGILSAGLQLTVLCYTVPLIVIGIALLYNFQLSLLYRGRDKER